MKQRPFRIEALGDHDRTDFDSGSEPLDVYLRTRAKQDVRRRVSACYVAIEIATGRLAGFYTLAAAAIVLEDLPAAARKRLPRYPTVPAVRVGRLAVDRRYQGRRLGSALLFDAITRTDLSGIAAFAIIVDAKDDAAVRFYQQFGFQSFSDLERSLFLPIAEGLRRLALTGPD